MEAERTGGGEPTEEQVCALLARYDIGRHPRLAALYSIAAYPHIRRCAVLVPLFVCPRDGLFHVLLTQRAATLSSHASVVAFPGGRQDPSDLDDVHTALREAQEEIGLDPSLVRVIARVPPTYVHRSNAVFPVIAFIPPDYKASPNPAEVDRVFSLPLQHFRDGGRVSVGVISLWGQSHRVPTLTTRLPDGTPLRVFGFTCVVCVALARALLGPDSCRDSSSQLCRLAYFYRGRLEDDAMGGRGREVEGVGGAEEAGSGAAAAPSLMMQSRNLAGVGPGSAALPPASACQLRREEDENSGAAASRGLPAGGKVQSLEEGESLELSQDLLEEVGIFHHICRAVAAQQARL